MRQTTQSICTFFIWLCLLPCLHAQTGSLGLDRHEFLQVAHYISTEMEKHIRAHEYFLTKEMTGLNCMLEYDPVTCHTFILLDGRKEAFLGRGGKKTVYKAILYDPLHPQELARGEQRHPMDQEMKMCQQLQGAPGIYATRAITSHTQGKTTYSTLYSDVYYPGSLTRKIFQKYRFSLEEKMKIIHDLLTGLYSLHERHLVHRDLHQQNYFLNIQMDPDGNRQVSAVIADLGRTIPIDQAKGVVAQGSRLSIAPEGFFVEKLEGTDYFATDIYAMGCVFYMLFHERSPEWIDASLLRNKALSRKVKSRTVAKKLKSHTAKVRHYLQSKKAQNRLFPEEDLELLILQMVHLDPKKRGTAKELLQEAYRISQRFIK